MTQPTWTLPRSRREAIRDLALAATALAFPASAFAARRGDEFPWPFDLDGDGRVTATDRALIANAVYGARGNRVRPDGGWRPHLDFLGLGRTTKDDLDLFDRYAPTLGTPLPPRPTVACWHYGWYGPGRRRGERATMRYLGGSYMSTDRRTEAQFNDLKREFGIDADILSWIDDRTILRAYERGYLSANNRTSRQLGLLYESQINLKAKGRLTMHRDGPYADKLAQDFRRMGAWLREATQDRGPRVLRVDGRPVIYLYGSHTFGVNDAGLPDVGRALDRARDEFSESFGQPPYLVGDESIFAGDAEVRYDRRFRARYFDATTRYHHYHQRQMQHLGAGDDVQLDADHIARIVELEERNAEGMRDVRNRYTDRPVAALPSSAAGFAKDGLPTLSASRADYEEFLTAMHRVARANLRRGRRSPAVEPPLVFVGSWNEEFEGHAVMPASRNEALSDRTHGGFDWLYAIKSRYGSAPG